MPARRFINNNMVNEGRTRAHLIEPPPLWCEYGGSRAVRRDGLEGGYYREKGMIRGLQGGVRQMVKYESWKGCEDGGGGGGAKREQLFINKSRKLVSIYMYI